MRRMRSRFRVQGVTWWPEELPSEAEYDEAIKNLEKPIGKWTVF
jgi:hypothetical protein